VCNLILGLRLDAEAGMNYLLHCQDIDRRKIILFGRSLGGAVAIDLASNSTYHDKYGVSHHHKHV